MSYTTVTHPKLTFLLEKYPSLLRSLDPSTKGLWGKMNVQQMIEHIIDSVQEANGKLLRTLMTPDERVGKMKEFLMSDKEFRPNTQNALMPETPLAERYPSIKEAVDQLEKELKYFVSHFEETPDLRIINPFFGNLNFEEWTQLLYKHAWHHLKQFGVAEKIID